MIDENIILESNELVENSKIVMVGTNGENGYPNIKSMMRLKHDGCEVYYPLGIDDPNYTVLCFTTEWANYYRHLKNVTFKIE